MGQIDMNERVSVDFSRVDAALRLVARERALEADRANAEVGKLRAENAAKLIKYGAPACALIIVSIGVAIWLATQRQIIEVKQPTALPREVHIPHSPPQNKIKTNIVQFNSIDSDDLKFSNRYFSKLAAGHRYGSSNVDHWDSAWCYAYFHRDGLTYQVDLETRQGSAIVPRAVSEAERRHLELSINEIAFLRGQCPWKTQ